MPLLPKGRVQVYVAFLNVIELMMPRMIGWMILLILRRHVPIVCWLMSRAGARRLRGAAAGVPLQGGGAARGRRGQRGGLRAVLPHLLHVGGPRLHAGGPVRAERPPPPWRRA